MKPARVTDGGEKLKDKAVWIPFEIAGCTNLTPKEDVQLYSVLYKLIGKNDLILQG